MKLTPAQKKFYQDNGFLAVENVIPLDLIAKERQRMEWLCEHWDSPESHRIGIGHESDVPKEKWSATTVRKFSGLAAHEPIFLAHATHPDFLDLVADLIGTPLSLYQNNALLKPPSVGSTKPAHQDNAYFKVHPDEAVITCWGAVDDATLDNGCMRYFPGSHKLGLQEHKYIPGTLHQVPMEGFHEKDAVPVPLKAGGIVFHHSLTMHLSLENTSSKWRRSYICHYVRTDADFTNASTPLAKTVKVRD